MYTSTHGNEFFPAPIGAVLSSLTSDEKPVSDRKGLHGAVDHSRFDRESVHLSGWAVLTDPEPTSPRHLVIVSGEDCVAHVRDFVVRPDLRARYGDVADSCGFQVELPLALLNPAGRDIRVAVFDERDSKLHELLTVEGKPVLEDVRIRTEREFTDKAAVPATRIGDLNKIAYMARWALDTYPSTSHTYASAVCVLGYRLIEQPSALSWLSDRVFETYETWMSGASGVADRYPRWRISGACVCGFLALLRRDFERAERLFGSFGDVAVELQKSPISAFNIAVGHFLAGWLSHKRGDDHKAVAHFDKVVATTKLGMASQPLSSNFHVYFDCVNMAEVGQQAVVVLSRLSPDRKIMVPSGLQPELKPAFKRVPSVLAALPDDMKCFD